MDDLLDVITEGVPVKVDVHIDVMTAMILAAAIFLALMGALAFYARFK